MENQNYTGPSPTSGGDSGKMSTEKQDLEDKLKQQQQEDVDEEEEDDMSSSGAGEKSKMAYSDDPTKVKFTNMVNHGGVEGSNNGEAKVDIENVQLSFAGMGKEELMKFANDPFWIRLRWILFILFWVIWAAMLAGAIIIVVTTPGCPPLPARDWWHKGVIYQVYPQSFKDSNGDGVGDLKGVESKLDYIKDLGVNAVWLNPIFPSPLKDGGYDIENYIDINKIFGTLEDFKNLIMVAKEKGIRIILDFVPNHTSDQHPWFVKSRTNETGYSDYYIWRDGTRPREPPNNWLSVFGGSAWAFDSKRNQHYLHQFLDSQPDLNLRNPQVRQELKKVLEFWLDLGVAGFRVDAVKHFFESENFEDEPPSNNPNAKPETYESLIHSYTTGLPETLELLLEWRELLDSYKEKDGEHRLLMVEVYDSVENTMSYYGNESRPLADFPFNFELVSLNTNDGAPQVLKKIKSWLSNLPTGAWPNWVLGNHDVHRFASRMGEQFVDAFNMIVMLIGGTPVTYYGEEIGMSDGFVAYDEQQDPLGKSHSKSEYEKYSRDFARTPMQWNETLDGFTSASKAWLPYSNKSQAVNVEEQLNRENSHLKIYKKLVELRKQPAVIYGDLHYLVNDNVTLSFARVRKGSPAYAVLINFHLNATVVDLTNSKCCEKAFKFPDEGILEISSQPSEETQGKQVRIPLNKVQLKAAEARLIKFVPNFD